ncbi:MAG: glycosyltransferase family 4 protein [Frankia sp.]
MRADTVRRGPSSVSSRDGPASLRVLIVHGRYRSAMPSGENKVVDRESDLLRDGGVEVGHHERASDEIAEWSTARRALLPARVVWSGAERRDLRRSIRRFRPSVVHVHNTFPLLSPSVLSACADEGVPVVMTLHNFRLACANGMLLRDDHPCEDCVGRLPLPAVRHGCYRDSRAATLPVAALIATHRALRTFARHVDTFILLTEFGRQIMGRAGLPADRMVVKPNFVPDPGSVRRGPGRHLLFLGRLEHAKGFDLVLDAWRDQAGGGGTLVVAGDGDLRAEAESAAAADPTVRYLGQCPPERVAELLVDARALLLPSRWYEGLPLSVLEAFAAGVGAIVSDHGSFRDITGPDHAGGGSAALRVPPGDVSALGGAMARLLVDDRLSISLGQHARVAYEERFSADRSLTQLLDIYRDVIARRSGLREHS